MLILIGIGSGEVSAQKDIVLLKDQVIKSVNQHQFEFIDLSDQIWAFAETALQEYKSSKLLSDYAESKGFKVTRGVAGMPTAFIAEFGSGRPYIGILGEYDALPGISQKASPVREPLVEGAAGHGCGHNMFGAASMGAALAIKELIEEGELNGTVRFYGTPAEEAVGGKIYMARDGLFDNLDVCMDWHPSAETKAGVQSSKAMIDFEVEFHGKTAHASGDPWNGRSALDGLELFNMGVNVLREHIRPTVRIHYVIKSGGDVPNVVPPYAKVWMWIRDSKRKGVFEVYERVKKIAEGASLMAEVDHNINMLGGDYEILVNRTGAQALHKNLKHLGDITYTKDEIDFANAIQKATEKELLGIDGHIGELEETLENPSGGSTDVGDVSWVVPVVRMRSTTAPKGTPWHSWAVVASGGMSIGHKGMLHAAKALSMTMVDLFTDPTLVEKIKEEFKERQNGHPFKAMVPDGPPPIPEMNKH